MIPETFFLTIIFARIDNFDLSDFQIALTCNKHSTIGIDLVAMCVNDLLAQGAAPLFFLDYYATSHLDLKIAQQVIQSISDGCSIAKCALVGKYFSFTLKKLQEFRLLL